jgi:uncharacterized protein YcbX
MDTLVVSQLFIYPIKSLGGIAVSESIVLPKGLEYDRRWMLIDDANRFLTQREHAAMALFTTSQNIELNSFLVHYQGQAISIPANPMGECMSAKVWDSEVEVMEVQPEISQWFSLRLKQAVRLVFFPENHTRSIDPEYALNNENNTSLSDGYPILIAGQASLDDLNTRLETPVSMDRFRPNIVFTGGSPYEEDGWKEFSIGNVRMMGVKPCARCLVTTIDQQSGVGGKEPLATLSKYRKVGNKVLFGQNVIPLESGSILVGAEITLY